MKFFNDLSKEIYFDLISLKVILFFIILDFVGLQYCTSHTHCTLCFENVLTLDRILMTLPPFEAAAPLLHPNQGSSDVARYATKFLSCLILRDFRTFCGRFPF